MIGRDAFHCVPMIGRDAFHCVPDISDKNGDAVERVPTGERTFLGCDLRQTCTP